MSFDVNKRHILQVDTRNQTLDYNMHNVKLKSVYIQGVKNLGVSNVSNLKLSQQCKDAPDKANRMLHFMKQKFLHRE